MSIKKSTQDLKKAAREASSRTALIENRNEIRAFLPVFLR